MNKHIFLISIICFSSFTYANQIKIRNMRPIDYNIRPDSRAQHRSPKPSQIDDEPIDFEINDDLNQEQIDQLIPFWKRIASKLITPFFMLYNWWQKKAE